MSDPPSAGDAVLEHLPMLYRFALSLAQDEATAQDLTQQTFYLWAVRGHQLRDPAKLKSWLCTTLHREFLRTRRERDRCPVFEPATIEQELPSATPEAIDRLDADALLLALGGIAEVYRTPLVLFYLEEHSYKEIAATLAVPIGTVMSRLARGKELLRKRLGTKTERAPAVGVVSAVTNTNSVTDP